MSIGRCVERAFDAKDRGDFEDAFIQASIAVAGTSDKEFPAEKSDNAKYKKFIRQNIALITKVALGSTFRQGIRLRYHHSKLRKSSDGTYSIEEILYHIVRCCLLHEAGLPANLEITDQVMIRTPDNGSPLIIPVALVSGMVTAVVAAPTNSNEEIAERFAISIRSVSIRLNDLTGKREHLNKLLGLER